MTPLGVLAMVQPPPLDLGFAEVFVTLLISAGILYFTGPALLSDWRRWTGTSSG